MEERVGRWRHRGRAGGGAAEAATTLTWRSAGAGLTAPVRELTRGTYAAVRPAPPWRCGTIPPELVARVARAYVRSPGCRHVKERPDPQGASWSTSASAAAAPTTGADIESSKDHPPDDLHERHAAPSNGARGRFVEQLIRPGVVDSEIRVRPRRARSTICLGAAEGDRASGRSSPH